MSIEQWALSIEHWACEFNSTKHATTTQKGSDQINKEGVINGII